VAAGEQPGLGAELLEQRERLLDAGRTLVREGCWDLQDCLLGSLLYVQVPVLWSACQTRVK